MQTIDKKAEEAKAEKGRYSEGDAHKRGESPSEVKNPMNGRSDRSKTIKSAAAAYKKMSESDTNAVGRR
jgi:hypothetical protein